MKQLSIIVPVYNVEPYIRASIESIFQQDLEEDIFEVIIVNDGSTDHSMEVIKDIISLHSNITVINQENQGLSVARNNGIAAAKGEYILMPDSDDLLIEYSLKPLLEKALETKVDLVVADFLKMNDHEIAEFKGISQLPLAFIEKTGEELFLADLNPYQCYVWRTLFRRAFLKDANLTFVPGVRFQDVPFIHECYIKAEKCLRTHQILNIYREGRIGAATSSFDKQKSMEFCTVFSKLWELTHLEGLSPKALSKLQDDIYVSFFNFCYATLFSVKSTRDRIQIIRRLNQEAPELRFDNGLKQKVETFLFKKMPWLFVILRELHWAWIRRNVRRSE